MFKINYLKQREREKNAKIQRERAKKPLCGEKRFTDDKNGACSREHVCTTGVDPG